MAARANFLAIALSALAGCGNLLGLDKEPSLAGMGPADAAIDMAPADVPADMDTTACAGMNCGIFGCDSNANMCRPAKLWLFLTIGSYAANGFGGTDNPPDVRVASDGLCFNTASQRFASRACSRTRTHAILTVGQGDPIQNMASNYTIPTDVPVHRIDDDVLVFDNWNDLTGMKAPRALPASATMAPTDADGIMWTGFGGPTAASCTSWTVKTGNGVVGHANGQLGGSVVWLGTGSIACDPSLQRLACICWSGGQ